MTKRLEHGTIKLQIDGLLARFPELADDDVLRSDMFEGETDLFEYLAFLERKRRHAEAQSIAAKIEIDAIDEQRKRLDRRVEGLRAAIFNMMQAADLRKAPLATATLSISSGTASVVITDEAAVPDQFVRIERKINKRAIKDELEAFNPVPGAMLSNGPEMLVIRPKLKKEKETDE